MHYSYVFSVQYDADGPYCDIFLDASLAHGSSLDEFRNVTAIAKRMGAPDEQLLQRERLERRLGGLYLRAQVTGSTLHCVHTTGPIDRTTLELVLQTKAQDHELKDFLNESSMR
jgi:hypothetical protein